MKIAVIAAQGRSGQIFVKEALAAGHSVVAGVRGESPFTLHDNLEIRQCDATNLEDVTRLIQGSDAVVSLIGHVKGAPGDIQTRAIKTIITAMNDAGLKRLVSLTGTGARVKGDTPSFIDRVLTLSIRIIDPKRVVDGRLHLEVLRMSDLDFTILRVLKLTNGNAGSFTLTPHGPGKMFVPRQEVARAILEVLENNTFARQFPVISSAQQ